MLRIYFIFCWSGFIAIIAAAIGWALINTAVAFGPSNTESVDVLKIAGILGLSVFCIHALALQLVILRIHSRIRSVREILSGKSAPVWGLALMAVAWVIKKKITTCGYKALTK